MRFGAGCRMTDQVFCHCGVGILHNCCPQIVVFCDLQCKYYKHFRLEIAISFHVLSKPYVKVLSVEVVVTILGSITFDSKSPGTLLPTQAVYADRSLPIL